MPPSPTAPASNASRRIDGEGRYLGHCVSGDGDHWPDIREGRILLLSYRTAAGIPIATAEIQREFDTEGCFRSWLVSQVQGPGNQPLTDPEAAANFAAFLFSFFLGSKSITTERFDDEQAWNHLDLPVFLSRTGREILVKEEARLAAFTHDKEAMRPLSNLDVLHVINALAKAFGSQIEESSASDPARLDRDHYEFGVQVASGSQQGQLFTVEVYLRGLEGNGAPWWRVTRSPNWTSADPVRGAGAWSEEGSSLLALLEQGRLFISEEAFLAQYQAREATITWLVPRTEVLLAHDDFLARRGLQLRHGRLVPR